MDVDEHPHSVKCNTSWHALPEQHASERGAIFGAPRCAFEAAARAREIATAAATAAAAAHATIEETAAVVSEAAVEPVSSATDDAALAVSTASTADALDEE